MEGGEVAHTQERARRYTPTYTITPVRPSPLFSTSFYPLFCHPRRSRNFWMVAYLFQASHSSLESIQKSSSRPLSAAAACYMRSWFPALVYFLGAIWKGALVKVASSFRPPVLIICRYRKNGSPPGHVSLSACRFNNRFCHKIMSHAKPLYMWIDLPVLVDQNISVPKILNKNPTQFLASTEGRILTQKRNSER